MSAEIQAIQKAMGEKFSLIIFSFGLAFAGLLLGFIKGWSLALAMTLIGPMIVIGFLVFIFNITKGVAETVKSYSTSAGYAEQALSAIRVVVAFGMELTEKRNYTKFLEYSRGIGRSTGVKSGFFFGFFLFMISATYAYAFTIGPIWVQNEVDNTLYGRPYSPGDIIGVFFGLIFGFFGLAGVGPNFKLLAEGKASGKLAFDVIDREPTINPDNEKGEKIDLKGKIEFENVDFYYPTRPDS